MGESMDLGLSDRTGFIDENGVQNPAMRSLQQGCAPYLVSAFHPDDAYGKCAGSSLEHDTDTQSTAPSSLTTVEPSRARFQLGPKDR